MEVREKRRNILTILIIITILCCSLNSYASWSGPITVVTGTWGKNIGQFGLEQGDTPAYDMFSGPFYILYDGTIIIRDVLNRRFVRYSSSGTIITTTVCVRDAQGNLNGDCRIVGDREIATESNGFWTESDENNNYYFQDNTGTLLTTTTRPMALGIVSHKITGTSHYARIEYPDGVYFYYYTGSTDYFPYASGIIRINTNLIMDVHNGMEPSRVYAFTATATQTPAGQKQQYQLFLNSSWVAPLPQYAGSGLTPPSYAPPGAEPPPPKIVAEYGQAVIGPDGSIYTYDRSDTDYKIVKWTWTP